MSRAVELSFQLSRADWKAYLKLLNGRLTVLSKANRKLLISNLLAWIPLGFALATFIAMYQKYPYANHDLNIVAIVGAIGIAGVVANLYYKHYLTQSVAISDAGGFVGAQKMCIDEQGVATWSRFGDASYQWGSFIGRAEDEGHIYLFVDNAAAVIIPKAVVATAEDMADIRRWTGNIPTT